jgi:hypothetical protein
MATIIPLNRFKSFFFSGLKSDNLYELYSAPSQRSSTVILAQCANTTNETRTVTLGVSSITNDTFYHLVKNFEIPANDARTLLTGRLILQGFDGATILNPEVLFIKDETPLTSSDLILINGFNNYLAIIKDPPNVPATFPRGVVSDSSYESAANLIKQYRSDLQTETVNYIKSISTALDDPIRSDKCFRDTGYIVDAIAADIENNANHRCVDTGIVYFSGFIQQGIYGTSPVPALPSDQVDITITAISAIGAFISGVGYVPTNTVFPNGILTNAPENARQQDVLNLVRTVYRPLSTNGNVYSYFPSGSATFSDIELADSLLKNKTKIQKIVSDYVFNKGYLTDATFRAKCNRDVGFMVESVANDLSTGVVSRSIQYAVAYWDGTTSRIPDSNFIPNQINKTLDTVEFLKKIALNINAPLSGGLTLSLGILETKY